MARHLVWGLCFVAISTLALLGCDKSTAPTTDRAGSHSAVGRVAAADGQPSRADRLHGGPAATDLTVVRAPSEQRTDDDPQPWLTELLHSPDPNVRIQALDAWARQPTASLDPVTYALVDSDESVRARAQQIFEQELARR